MYPFDKLPKAEDARSMTTSINIQSNSELISEILKRINSAVADGKYSITINGVLHDAIFDLLRSKGYHVRSKVLSVDIKDFLFDVDVVYTVSW